MTHVSILILLPTVKNSQNKHSLQAKTVLNKYEWTGILARNFLFFTNVTKCDRLTGGVWITSGLL